RHAGKWQPRHRRPFPALGNSSTVEQRTLTPSILVRIQVPQPGSTAKWFLRGPSRPDGLSMRLFLRRRGDHGGTERCCIEPCGQIDPMLAPGDVWEPEVEIGETAGEGDVAEVEAVGGWRLQRPEEPVDRPLL